MPSIPLDRLIERLSFRSQRTAEKFANVLRDHLSVKLHSGSGSTLAAAYMDGLSIETTETGVVMSLRGALPRAIELGMPAYDMREVMLKSSPPAKRAKAGHLYLVVPFELGLPTTQSPKRKARPGAGGAVMDFSSGMPSLKAFRTISQAVKSGWYHPGMQARNYIKETVKEVGQLVSSLLRGT